MSTWLLANWRHRLESPDSSASTSKSNPTPFQVRIVKPLSDFRVKYSSNFESSRCFICLVGRVLLFPPCQIIGISSPSSRVAAQQIPSGRYRLQSAPSNDTTFAVSMSNARHLRFMLVRYAPLVDQSLPDVTGSRRSPVCLKNAFSRSGRPCNRRNSSVIRFRSSSRFRGVKLGKHVRFSVAAASSRPPGIPTGFRPKAQGCEARATLSHRPTHLPNRDAVAAIPFPSLARDVRHNPVGVVSISQP